MKNNNKKKEEIEMKVDSVLQREPCESTTPSISIQQDGLPQQTKKKNTMKSLCL